MSTLVDKTLMEVWIGKNHSIQCLHVFGYGAYVRVPKEKKLKLDKKEMKSIFINYGVGVKV
jgi:hypothetical protein